MTVTYEKYMNEKKQFLIGVPDWTLKTSSMNAYDVYEKTYSNGKKCWHEVMSPVTEFVEIEVHGLKIKQDVKLLKTEFWSTKDSVSKICYEKF